MSRYAVLRPEAMADLIQASNWYGQESLRLADEFADSFEASVARIEATPELYPVALNDVRRGKLQRFPYLIYYRVLADRIEVLGVLHGRRHPEVWQERAG
jgi:plasmid stabilization system protein ParE